MKFHNLREENNKKNFLSKIDFSIPGKIIYRSSNFYKPFQNFRFLFCFEKIFLDLYDKTIKEIGIENTKKLCHELGIEVGYCFYCALKLKASKDQSLIFLKNSLKF